MTSEDALEILTAKETEKRRLEITKEAKRLEKLSKRKKQLHQKNAKNQ